jgi:hypothetical protein
MAAMNGGNKGNMDGDEQSHFQPRPPVQMSDFTTVALPNKQRHRRKKWGGDK